LNTELLQVVTLFLFTSGRLEFLNEVVVIGYGSQKKREVTGAVSIVASETLKQNQ
jgi:hypothetical protein